MQTSWPIAVILTLKAEGSSDCLHHRHPEPFKGEGSSNVLYMKYNWMLRCAQHDEIRAEAFGVMARRAYNAKGLPVEYNRKSEGWDWVFL